MKKRPAPKRGRPLILHDRALGERFVVGVDEAGRGCLAGPIVAAGVLLDLDSVGPAEVRALAQLTDSKQLRPEVRDELLGTVMAVSSSCAVVSRSARWIDRHGLHVTNMAALADAAKRAAGELDALCLVDGFALPEFGLRQRRVVGGDGKSAAIAAASIIAKVTRDRMMQTLAHAHPHWGFDRHMGYGTAVHVESIATHGLSPIHRRSFRPIAEHQQVLDFAAAEAAATSAT